MYDSEKAVMETIRVKFERQVAGRDAAARTTAMEYMAALKSFVDAFNDGPGADPRQMEHDTTGTLSGIEADVVLAEAERHRVRKLLTAIS
jgi:hypothetical protein